jgi:murein DD-endopeptidase MepM/ murein hydrolase activator NlpD
MGEKGYTILILTDLSARARQLRISQRVLSGALLGGALALVTLSYLLYHYVAFQANQGELERLRQTVEAQRGVATRLETLAREVTRLRAFDRQIRRLAGMEEESTAAMGGGALDLQKALAAGEQAEYEQLIEGLYLDLQRLEREVALRAESLGAVTTYLTKQKDRLAATPSIWPLQDQGRVSSGFGPRISPFTGRRQQHTGLDIAAPRGTPILAAADGVVTFSGRLAGYGRAIVITHGFGFKTFYGHNQKNKVRKGQRVKRGQEIGTVGSSGYSTGSHVHYEVLVKGGPVNPLKYIVDEGRRAQALRAK